MKNKNKNKKVIERNLGNNSTGISTIVKIAIGVVIVFVLAYLLFAILTGEIKLKKDKKTEPTIQYVEILAETTFKQNNDDYFVLFYGFNDNEANLLETISEVLGNTTKTYKVDLDKKFNTNYIANNEDIDKTPKNIEELKVENPTLIRIKKGKVTEFITGVENIKNYSQKLG